MEGKIILTISLIAVLLIGVVSFDDAFAKDHKEPKPPKEKKLKNNDIVAMFAALWDAIADLQAQIANLTFVQDDLDEPVLELQVDPNSNAPALVVSDGTDDLFLVNKDGSIQIGSNTVVISPDGTITAGGQPLVVQGSVGQTSFLQEWQTSDGTRVGTINPSGVLTANSFVGDGSELTGLALSIYINEETKTMPPFSFFINFAVGCDDGDELIGGGGRGADAGARVLVASQPVTDFNGENFWNVIFKDVPNTGGDVTGKAICVDTADPQHIP